MSYSPGVACSIHVGRPVEAMQLVIKITKELHGKNVLSSLLQLFLQMGDIKLTIMIVLMVFDPHTSAFLLTRSIHLKQKRSHYDFQILGHAEMCQTCIVY